MLAAVFAVCGCETLDPGPAPVYHHTTTGHRPPETNVSLNEPAGTRPQNHYPGLPDDPYASGPPPWAQNSPSAPPLIVATRNSLPLTPPVIPVSAPPQVMPAIEEEPNCPSSTLPPAAEGPVLPGMGVVNSRRIQLSYEVKDAVFAATQVVVWMTRNGGPWQRHSVLSSQSPCVVEVPSEGLYGFTLRATNGGSLSAPPAADEIPQYSVEVDTTRPEVCLTAVKPTPGAGRGVAITWTADDKNLGPRPISLYYAQAPAGPWLPIVTGLENTGHHVWHPTAGVPSRVLVRVEGMDLAGNVGLAQLAAPVVLREPQPTVLIRGVEPAKPPARVVVVGVQPAGEQ